MIAALAAVVCLAMPATMPVEGVVNDWFRRPACPRCAGNRGLEFVVSAGSAVSAPLPGEVTFSGSVGGVGYVVISVRASAHDGVGAMNAILGGLEQRDVHTGQAVEAGQQLGRAGRWLFVGFRMGPRPAAAYLDPAPLFGLLRRPARLVARVPAPVSLARRPDPRIRPSHQQRHCSVLPPVVASARGPGP